MFSALERIHLERFMIDHLVDGRGRFEYEMDREFPFLINFFSFSPLSHAFRLNWHERLELFVPIQGEGRFRMGGQFFPFSPGDIIVVDNLKLHGISDFRGAKRHAVVITFMANLVYNLGSTMCDFIPLSPFYCKAKGLEPVLRSTDRLAGRAHGALSELLDCYSNSGTGPEFQAGCKAYLLELLYHLARHFRSAEVAHTEYVKRQQQSMLLGKLVAFLEKEYTRRVPVEEAAAIVEMTESQFMKFFKRATGLSFVSYVIRARLARAYELLTREDLSIAEVSSAVGFSDQSYFDRKFKEAFHQTPREVKGARHLAHRPAESS